MGYKTFGFAVVERFLHLCSRDELEFLQVAAPSCQGFPPEETTFLLHLFDRELAFREHEPLWRKMIRFWNRRFMGFRLQCMQETHSHAASGETPKYARFGNMQN